MSTTTTPSTCRCGHPIHAHELRSGGLLGCFLYGCCCIDFELEPARRTYNSSDVIGADDDRDEDMSA